MTDIFGENTGLYFYGSVFQGNMALLALVGVFAVYKLQQLSHSVEANSKQLVDYVQDRLASVAIYPPAQDTLRTSYRDVDKLIDTIDALRGDNIGSSNVDALNEALERLRRDPVYLTLRTKHSELQSLENSVRKNVKTPFFWTLGVIVGSLVLLAGANVVHHQFACLEFAPLLLIITANIWALKENAQYILVMLRKD